MIKIDKEKGTALIPFYVAQTKFGWDKRAVYNTITNKAFEPRYGYDTVKGVFNSKPVDYSYITYRGYEDPQNDIIEKLHLCLTVYTEPVFLDGEVYFKIDDESEKRLNHILDHAETLQLKIKAKSMVLKLGLTEKGEFNDTIL